MEPAEELGHNAIISNQDFLVPDLNLQEEISIDSLSIDMSSQNLDAENSDPSAEHDDNNEEIVLALPAAPNFFTSGIFAPSAKC
jgi:hypothetical protein